LLRLTFELKCHVLSPESGPRLKIIFMLTFTLGVEGAYRIRGLPPNCPITISVRSDKSTDVRRASPTTRLIQVLNTHYYKYLH